MKQIKTFILLTLCGLLVLAAIPAYGKNKIEDLEFPPLGEFDIPEPDRYVLDNGMTVYLLEDHTLPKVNIYASLNRCGSYLEGPEKLGLAAMVGEVLRTGGTTSMAGDEIDEKLEAVGAYVETSIGRTSGSLNANALSDYTDLILSMSADILRNPVFDQDKIELSRTGIKTGISRRNDEPMDICIREYRKLLYGEESVYARHEEYATIDAVTRDDMIKFHKDYVQPNNIQLAVWGDFDRNNMLADIKKYFGDWPRAEMETKAPPEVDYDYQPSVNYAEKTDVNQSNILVGHIGGVMGDPDYPATIVMNSVLGGSFGSRLTNTVRSKLGLAYTAQGRYSFNYEYPGWFYAYAATKSESTVKAIRAIIDQIKSMQTDPPTPDEMSRAKDGWLNSYVFNFDTKGEILGRIMTYDYYGMDHDYLEQLKEAVIDVEPEDVVEVAKRKLHPDALQILVVGKADEFDEPLTVFGNVNDIDIAIPGPEEAEFAASNEEMGEGMQILAEAAEACGGVESFKNVESMVTEGDLTLKTPNGPMTMALKSIMVAPDKSAQIIKTPMGEQVMVFNGTAGWQSMGGQTQAMQSSDIEEALVDIKRSQIWLFSHLEDKDFIQVASKGIEEFNGKQAHRLDFKTEQGKQFTMFIDSETKMPIGMRYMGQTMAGPGEIVVKMSDFKEFGGIMVPTKRVQEAGQIGMEVELTSVTINGEFDETIFDKPEGL